MTRWPIIGRMFTGRCVHASLASRGMCKTTSAASRLAVMQLVFASPLLRRAGFASMTFKATIDVQSKHLRCVTAFPVSGVYTYVRDSQLTTAGLRGSRAAELITQLDAANQIQADVVRRTRRSCPRLTNRPVRLTLV
jgi:hypothetical protein